MKLNLQEKKDSLKERYTVVMGSFIEKIKQLANLTMSSSCSLTPKELSFRHNFEKSMFCFLCFIFETLLKEIVELISSFENPSFPLKIDFFVLKIKEVKKL